MVARGSARAWYCGKCGFLNGPDEPTCQNCGLARAEGAAFAQVRQGAAGPDLKTRTGLILAGVGLVVVGAFVTLFTLGLASSGSSGGIFIVAFGPIIAGFAMILRGASSRSPAMRRR